MTKIVRAFKAALALRSKGATQYWRWVHYHDI
jgi:hypothetical protein